MSFVLTLVHHNLDCGMSRERETKGKKNRNNLKQAKWTLECGTHKQNRCLEIKHQSNSKMSRFVVNQTEYYDEMIFFFLLSNANTKKSKKNK